MRLNPSFPLTHPPPCCNHNWQPAVHLMATGLPQDNSGNFITHTPTPLPPPRSLKALSNILKWLTAQALLNFWSMLKVIDLQRLSWLTGTTKVFFLVSSVSLVQYFCRTHNFPSPDFCSTCWSAAVPDIPWTILELSKITFDIAFWSGATEGTFLGNSTILATTVSLPAWPGWQV